jgi:hypothetical protein
VAIHPNVRESGRDAHSFIVEVDMSLEWLSWVLWAGISLFGGLASQSSAPVFVIAFGSTALLVFGLFENGQVAGRWRESK